MNCPIEDIRQHGVVVYRVLFARVSHLLGPMSNGEALVLIAVGWPFIHTAALAR